MITVTSDADPHHIPWLHGSGISAHDCDSLVKKLSQEMRRVTINPRARGKSPMHVMRAELNRLVDEAVATGDYSHTLGLCVFASLDCKAISKPHYTSLRDFPISTWNEIAPHLTKAHIDAVVASGRRLSELPYPGDGTYTHLTEEVGAHVASHIRPGDGPATLPFIEAARFQEIPGAIAMIAVRRFLEDPILPRPHGGSYTRAMTEKYTTLRILTAMNAEIWDTWEPDSSQPDLARLLAMTRSNHGRLNLHRLIPDQVAFLGNPGPLYAKFRD